MFSLKKRGMDTETKMYFTYFLSGVKFSNSVMHSTQIKRWYQKNGDKPVSTLLESYFPSWCLQWPSVKLPRLAYPGYTETCCANMFMFSWNHRLLLYECESTNPQVNSHSHAIIQIAVQIDLNWHNANGFNVSLSMNGTWIQKWNEYL